MTVSSDAAPAAVVPPGRPHWTRTVLKTVLAAILALVMVDLLVGVLLRYVVIEITDFFDWPSVSFFWVEEVGEFGLAWLVSIGAAVAIIERTHFALAVVTHRFSPRTRIILDRVNHLLIAGFGGFIAYQGVKISMLNAMLESPGLGLNLAWLYASAVVGGAITVIYGLGVGLGLMQAHEPGAH